jgi:hypothetical protein
MANGTVFTTVGKSIVTNRMIGAGTEPKWIEIGTGTTTPAIGDTALVTPVESRAVGTSSRVTTTVSNDTYQTVGTITATGARAVTEAGTFDALTTGNMAVRSVFDVVNLATSDSITLTVKLAFS